MRRKSPLLLILVFFGGWVFVNRAAETAQPVVSVAAFDGDKQQIHDWSPSFGQAISEMVFETLENTNENFQIVQTPPAGSAAETQSAGTKSNLAPSESKKSTQSSSGSSATSGTESNSSANCDFVLQGNVTEFSAQTNSSTVGDFISSGSFGNLGGKWVTAHVRIDWRLEETKTKRVVTRGTAVGAAHGSQFDTASASSMAEKRATDTLGGGKTTTGKKNASVANFLDGMSKVLNGSSSTAPSSAAGMMAGATNKTAGESKTIAVSRTASKVDASSGNSDNASESPVIGYDNSVFMESALGKATDDAVRHVVQELVATQLPEPDRIVQMKKAAGKVLAVAGSDMIIVSLGSNQGLKEGDKLNLYQTVDVKDDKGNVVFTDEKLAGEITLLAVQDDRSRASYSGDAKVQQGWTVKPK